MTDRFGEPTGTRSRLIVLLLYCFTALLSHRLITFPTAETPGPPLALAVDPTAEPRAGPIDVPAGHLPRHPTLHLLRARDGNA